MINDTFFHSSYIYRSTDRAIAKIFLQEFLEAQRAIRNAPPTSFSKDVPGELAKFALKPADTVAGFLSFAVVRIYNTSCVVV